MQKTMTINDQLVELGTLVTNNATSIQRAGAEMVEAFFNTHQQGDNVDDDTVAQILYYLTDIQVRDYALGLLEPDNADKIIPALHALLEHAPTDTIYINAPACLLSVMHYEMHQTADAVLMLTNASTDYSLARLLINVMRAGWTPAGFAKMRAELHPKVKEGIFG